MIPHTCQQYTGGHDTRAECLRCRRGDDSYDMAVTTFGVMAFFSTVCPILWLPLWGAYTAAGTAGLVGGLLFLFVGAPCAAVAHVYIGIRREAQR